MNLRTFILAILVMASALTVVSSSPFVSLGRAENANTAPAIVDTPPVCDPPGTVSPIPDKIWDQMQGTSWHAGMGCPARNELRYLRIPYLDFNKHARMGEMITAQSVAGDVLSAFTTIFCSRDFTIEKMQLIYQYGGSDSRSMDDNNTSGFNCRLTSSGKRLSEHSFGKAIDINPIQNPYVNKETTVPASAFPYNSTAERLHARQGMIRKTDVVARAFSEIDWKWGGDWRYSKDYQHFSSSGR